MTSSSASEPDIPRSFAALHHRGYRPFFIGNVLTMTADSVEHVISYWVMHERFDSAALGGFAVISHWVPYLLLSIWSGAMADRHDARRMIQFGMGLFMLVSLGWAVLIATDTLQMWHAMVLLTLHGVAGVFWGPPSQVLIHDIVGGRDLQSGVRLNATGRWLGMLAGPAVGAGFLLLFGPSWGLVVNAALYLPLALWLWKAPYGPRFRQGEGPPPRSVRGLADVVRTFREVRGLPIVMAMVMLAGGASLFIGNAYQAQMPAFAHDLGHGHMDFTYSALIGADAAGALLAGLLLESRGLLPPAPRTAFVLAMIWCVAIAGFALSSWLPLAMALLFVAGFVELSFAAMAQTLVQIHAPPGSRGRIIGVYNMSAMGMRSFSGVTVGLVGGALGIHASLAMAATAMLIYIVAMRTWLRAR
ncbi:MAG: MFS transporter [Burkholderiaceae bacterium]